MLLVEVMLQVGSEHIGSGGGDGSDGGKGGGLFGV